MIKYRLVFTLAEKLIDKFLDLIDWLKEVGQHD